MKTPDSLEDCVRASLDRYLDDLGDADPTNLWEMVVQCVEKPVLDMAMTRAGGNQSRAAVMLGMTRSTLRKKLAHHGLQPGN